MHYPRQRRIKGWAAGVTAAATLALVGIIAVLNAGTSDAAQLAAAAAPAPPPGFTLTWSDEFNGAANTGVNTGTWKYDTGPGSTFGTGEIAAAPTPPPSPAAS